MSINRGIHMKMLQKSFHRKEDGMTSILLGHAVSIATEYFESRTCSNCKYWSENETCSKLTYEISDYEQNFFDRQELQTEPTFGCNKFSCKQG